MGRQHVTKHNHETISAHADNGNSNECCTCRRRCLDFAAVRSICRRSMVRGPFCLSICTRRCIAVTETDGLVIDSRCENASNRFKLQRMWTSGNAKPCQQTRAKSIAGIYRTNLRNAREKRLVYRIECTRCTCCHLPSPLLETNTFSPI